MKHQAGAALLIVVALMGLTTTLIMHAWFITSLQFDIVQQRELWYKKFYAAEMVLNVGLVQVGKQFEQFKKRVDASKEPVTVDLSSLLGQDAVLFVTALRRQSGNSSATVDSLQSKTDGLIVRSGQLQCKLSKVERDKEIHFVASHFTIGAGV